VLVVAEQRTRRPEGRGQSDHTQADGGQPDASERALEAVAREHVRHAARDGSYAHRCDANPHAGHDLTHLARASITAIVPICLSETLPPPA
jgi:hypothetical protein